MAKRKADKMAAMSPAFPKGKRSGGKKAKSTETKTSVDPGIEGYTPKGAMEGGGTTTRGGKGARAARARRLAGMPV